MSASIESPPIEAAALNQAEAVEALLSRLEGLARQPLAAREFFQQAVEGLLSALSAISVAAWAQSDAGLQCLHRAATPTRVPERLDPEVERRLCAQTLVAGEPRMLAPGSSLSEDLSNTSSALQFFCPRAGEGTPAFVLRAALRPEASHGARETAGGLLAAVAEIAWSFQLHARLRQFEQQEDFWQDLDQALAAIYAARGTKAAAPAIAEQTRRLLGCDRVSVLIRHGRGCRLTGLSSSTRIDRRGRQVRLLERVARQSIATGQTLSATVGEGTGISDSTLDQYLDATQARAVRCEPLQAPGMGAVGALCVESFTADQVSSWPERLAVLRRHAAQALARAQDDDRGGWRGLLFPFRSLASAGIWTVMSAVIVAAVAALIVVPADFRVEATGRLMPSRSRGVFSPANAIVTQVFVDDGAAVTLDQPLAALTDPALELEHSRLTGELQTTAARLQAVQARRRLRVRDPETDAAALAVEEEELKATLDGLQKQLDVVERQRRELTLKSPFDGRIARWDLRDVLHSLPVQHGQRLMDVYDPAGDWRLELQIPDHVSGYVRESQQESGPVEVEYVFQADAAHPRTAKLDRLDNATELDSKGNLTVRGTVDLDADELNSPRRGATVLAKIHCGRRSLGFVWFRELIEFVHRNVLF